MENDSFSASYWGQEARVLCSRPERLRWESFDLVVTEQCSLLHEAKCMMLLWHQDASLSHSIVKNHNTCSLAPLLAYGKKIGEKILHTYTHRHTHRVNRTQEQELQVSSDKNIMSQVFTNELINKGYIRYCQSMLKTIYISARMVVCSLLPTYYLTEKQWHYQEKTMILGDPSFSSWWGKKNH